MDIQGYHVRFDNLLINNADSYNSDKSSSVTDGSRLGTDIDLLIGMYAKLHHKVEYFVKELPSFIYHRLEYTVLPLSSL